jgi:hypothetical protein
MRGLLLAASGGPPVLAQVVRPSACLIFAAVGLRETKIAIVVRTRVPRALMAPSS